MSTPNRITEALKVNLAEYVAANAEGTIEDYKVKRELGIARKALEDGANTYLDYTQVIETKLKAQIKKFEETGDLVALAAIEGSMDLLRRSALTLVNTVQNVVKTAKVGVEIENIIASRLDVVQVYSILSSLPALLSTLIKAGLLNYFEDNNLTIQNGKVLNRRDVVEELADLLLNRFNDELQRNVSVLTYTGTDALTNSQNVRNSGGGPVAVVEQTVVDMLRTVPTGPVVLDADNPTASKLLNS